MLIKVLLGIVLISAILAIMGVWFPKLFEGEVAAKLIWTFVIVAIAAAVGTGVYQYIPR